MTSLNLQNTQALLNTGVKKNPVNWTEPNYIEPYFKLNHFTWFQTEPLFKTSLESVCISKLVYKFLLLSDRNTLSWKTQGSNNEYVFKSSQISQQNTTIQILLMKFAWFCIDFAGHRWWSTRQEIELIDLEFFVWPGFPFTLPLPITGVVTAAITFLPSIVFFLKLCNRRHRRQSNLSFHSPTAS